MKRVFSIIILICTVGTIGLVAFNFLHDLEPAYKIYNHTYNYTQHTNTKILYSELNDCSDLTTSVLASTTLTNEQKSYLQGLATSISKLDSFEYTLALTLISEDKKTSKTSKIIKSIKQLNTLRNELLFELDVYTIKMSGNTIGDPVGTYSNIIETVLNFLNEYNNTFDLLKDYIVSEDINFNITTINIFNIYSTAIENLYNNFDKENIYFKNEAYSTILKLNNLIVISNNNLETVVAGGVYSTTAYNFNYYFSKVETQAFVQKFHLKSYDNIDISTEKQLDTLTYYYLLTLLEVE